MQIQDSRNLTIWILLRNTIHCYNMLVIKQKLQFHNFIFGRLFGGTVKICSCCDVWSRLQPTCMLSTLQISSTDLLFLLFLHVGKCRREFSYGKCIKHKLYNDASITTSIVHLRCLLHSRGEVQLGSNVAKHILSLC